MAASLPSQTQVYRILLVGNSGVGKTSAIRSYLGETFTPIYTPTVGLDIKNHTIRRPATDGATGSVDLELEMFDTSGQDRYRTITTQFYGWAYCFLLMFDLTSDVSFKSLSQWVETIKAIAVTPPKMLLIGNKKDLECDRSVTFEEASTFANKLDCSYIESSAKEGTSIQECFEMLVEGSMNE